MKYSDNQRIVKMRETTQKLLDYLEREHITTETVLEQEPVRWAITTPLYNIGEQAYQLSDAFKEAHPEAPWAKISGLRHRLVHDYENTNWNLTCSIIFEILPWAEVHYAYLHQKGQSSRRMAVFFLSFAGAKKSPLR